MAAPLLSLKGVGLGFGGRPLFEDVDLAVQDGDRLCLVGRNGSGKSTLLKILAGQIEPDAGERLVRQGARAAYLPQDPDLGGYGRVADYVAAGLSAVGEAHQVDILLAAVGVAGDADPATLSGGEARRAAIARCLVGDPDVLLLDEPTNHLDLPTIEWLEGALAGFRGAVVMISHDRRFLNDLGRETVWLERGRLRRVERRLADFETWREEFFEKEAAERARMDKLIAEETRWSHQGITARRKRNQGRLRRLHELRGERARQIARIGNVKLALESGTSSGRLVVDAENVAKHYGDRPILADVSVRVLRGDRIGIIGPNGAGKSTLLRLLTGDLAPDAGTVRLGTNLTTVYLDQQRSSLDPDRTVWDTLCEGGGDQVIVHGRPRHVVSYLRDFLFDERQARSPVGALSGGERNRLLLARALARPSNFLILDEPTNDLDMDTLDLLQELLADYDGTLLLVSHDRDFLDRVVTATLAVEGDGRVSEYPGGFSDYERQRKAPAADAAPKKKPSGSEKPKSSSAKLSYKDKRDLELLPGRIADLEQTLVRLESELADPALYQNQPETFAAKARELEANQADLAAAEERWLELELLKEELGG